MYCYVLPLLRFVLWMLLFIDLISPEEEDPEYAISISSEAL